MVTGSWKEKSDEEAVSFRFQWGLASLNHSAHPAFSRKHGGRVQIKGLGLESLIQRIRAQTAWLFEEVESHSVY